MAARIKSASLKSPWFTYYSNTNITRTVVAGNTTDTHLVAHASGVADLVIVQIEEERSRQKVVLLPAPFRLVVAHNLPSVLGNKVAALNVFARERAPAVDPAERYRCSHSERVT
jgi:hypothetical protein